MSLINDMLKDIEARGGSEVEQAKGVRAPAAVHKPSARLLVLPLSALVVVLAATVAYLTWQGPRDAPLNALIHSDSNPARAATPETLTIAPDDKKGTTAEKPEAVPTPAPAAADVSNATDTLQTAASITVAEEVEAAPAVQKQSTPPAITGSDAAKEAGDDGAMVVRRHEPSPEQRAQRAGREGAAALRRGDWAAAARLLQEVIVVEPANDDAREGLVIALQRQGRLSETDGALLDGIAMARDPARFAKMRARLQASRNELDGALDTLSIAVPPVDVDPEYHALKAALAQQAGRLSEAAEIYSALTDYAPRNGTWLAGLAIALDGQGEQVAARDAYIRALQSGGLDRALIAHAQRRLTALNEALGNE